MANPTNPFNWQMPTASDLVTDLPADFETFGQAVATSMADLLGGTTGQVLSKASNTNMDFTWVTTDDANAIQNSIVDAKGDIVAASANDTPARLAVGNNGETLVADSSTSTGLRYNPQNALANPVINGGFDVWQRGTSFTYAGGQLAYQADRWQGWGTGGGSAYSVTRQTTSDTTNLPNIQYCIRMQRPTGNTNTDFWAVVQSFENVNSTPFIGKTVTMSFYARRGANYSGASNVLYAQLISGTGTDQNVTGFTGYTQVISSPATLTTTWQRFAFTGTVGSTATQLGINFNFQGAGTAGAADYFEVTGVQIDLGTYTASTAPSFRRSQGTIQGELSAAQRYYYLHATGVGQDIAAGWYHASSDARASIKFPVTMRTSPTLVATTGTNYYGFEVNNGIDTFNDLTINRAQPNSAEVYVASNVSGTAGQAGEFYTNNASASLAFSAEL
jgi:hypothetical protein